MTTYFLTAIGSPTKRWTTSDCTIRAYPDIANGTKFISNTKIGGNYKLSDNTWVKGSQVHLDSTVVDPPPPPPPPPPDDVPVEAVITFASGRKFRTTTFEEV